MPDQCILSPLCMLNCRVTELGKTHVPVVHESGIYDLLYFNSGDATTCLILSFHSFFIISNRLVSFLMSETAVSQKTLCRINLFYVS